MQVAQGFIKVANEAMCRPIRALTQMRGYNVANHVLSCFGGAGGQHACAIARSLGMRTIFVHRYSGVLSAVGIGLADMVAERQVTFLSLSQLSTASKYHNDCSCQASRLAVICNAHLSYACRQADGCVGAPALGNGMHGQLT